MALAYGAKVVVVVGPAAVVGGAAAVVEVGPAAVVEVGAVDGTGLAPAGNSMPGSTGPAGIVSPGVDAGLVALEVVSTTAGPVIAGKPGTVFFVESLEHPPAAMPTTATDISHLRMIDSVKHD